MLPLSLALALGGCGDDGEGELEVRVWGEGFIEEGIPASELSDGWAIEFDRFDVQLRDVSVAGVSLPDPDTFDLSEASDGVGQLVGRASTSAGDYEDAQFTIASVEVEGSAEQAGVTKRFTWTFTTAVSYSNCETVTEIPRDGEGELQITVHADHLFYDSLVSEDPALRFDAIAEADADGDDIVTEAELAAADLGGYDPGNLEIVDLWAFLSAQAQTMGHANGEYHCQS